MNLLAKLIGAVLLIGSVSAMAAPGNPLQALEEAILQAKAEANSGNKFASSSGLCLGGVGVFNSGPVAMTSMRMCTYRIFPRDQIQQLMATNNWPLAFAGNNVEYYRYTLSTSSGWYMTVYNKAGQASEIVVLVDLTTD